MEKQLAEILNAIQPADEKARMLAKERQEKLAKPPGSLGKLEDISIQLAGITGKVKNHIDKKRMIVLCADNGVVEEGVSSSPVSVTAAQAVNMTRHKTGMSSIAAAFGCEIQVVDVGIKCPYDCDAVINAKIAPGTKNLHREPAMTREQALTAILTGVRLARQAKEEGVDIIGIGEMGIGNTTTSSLVLMSLTGISVEAATGRGGGLTDEAFALKKRVIRESLELHRPDSSDVVDVLSKVGGFDIAAMCGVFLGAALERIPAVIDGFISVVAALSAVKLCPEVKAYLFPSHASYEPGYSAAIEALGLSPWLMMNMRLGEGSGCPIAFAVIEAACAAMNDMALFGEESEIDDSYLDDIRGKDSFSI